jgi:IclR family acetate operon transcriptional repressor
LGRGLAVLHALGSAADGCTVAELASATALDRAVLYRLLGTLEKSGFVVRDGATRRFHLGVALVELGARASRGLEVRRVAVPAMKALVDQVGEVVFLAVRDRNDVVVVDRVEPPALFVRVGYHVGFRHPLTVGAHGRALLAYLGGAEREELAGRDARLVAELHATRSRGFALSKDELERGASGVAAPVLDRAGRPIASIGVVAPTARLADPGMLGPRVHGLAIEVSRRLGFAGVTAAR